MYSPKFNIQYQCYNSIVGQFDDFHDVNICFIPSISNKSRNSKFILNQPTQDLGPELLPKIWHDFWGKSLLTSIKSFDPKCLAPRMAERKWKRRKRLQLRCWYWYWLASKTQHNYKLWSGNQTPSIPYDITHIICRSKVNFRDLWKVYSWWL